jgi:acyl transferase domain-containing protein
MGSLGVSRDEITPIAVIGLSGRFPGEATNVEKLWEMCSAGENAWSPIPSDRFNSKAFYHPDSGRDGSVSFQTPIKEMDKIAHTSRLMPAVVTS